MSDRAAILSAVADLNKHFGRSVVLPASEYPAQVRIPIGIPVTDYCMGGGFPTGRAIELYGGESSTKTYHAQKTIAAFQRYDWGNNILDGIKVLTYKQSKVKSKLKDGSIIETIINTPDKIEGAKGCKLKYVALIDVEKSYIPDWGAYMGIDNKLLIHVVPETGEQAIDVADALLRNPDISLVVFDSVMVAKASAEIEKSMEDQTMGQQARFWSRASSKFQAAMNVNTMVSMILINRAYDKIGLVFGDPEVIAGGRALRHFKAISMKLTALKIEKGEIDGVDTSLGRVIKVENKKNKTARPYKSGDFYFCLADDPETGLKFGETDEANDLTELGVRLGIVEKSGSRYKYGRLQINGREKFVQTLREKSGILNTLKYQVINHV